MASFMVIELSQDLTYLGCASVICIVKQGLTPSVYACLSDLSNVSVTSVSTHPDFSIGVDNLASMVLVLLAYHGI